MGNGGGDRSFAVGLGDDSFSSIIMDCAISIDSTARFSFFFRSSSCHGGTSGSSFFGLGGGGLARGLLFTFGGSSVGGCEGCEGGGGVSGGGGGGLSSLGSTVTTGVFRSGIGGGPVGGAGFGGSSTGSGSSIFGSKDSTPSTSAFCILFCLRISFFNSSFSTSGSAGGRGLGVGLRLGLSRVAASVGGAAGVKAGGPACPRRGRVGGLLRSYPSRSGEREVRSKLPLRLRTACLHVCREERNSHWYMK